MVNILNKIKGLTTAKKIQFIVAFVLTVAMITAIPVYAWFTNQKKAAEMYKIEYPNSLYINAAHREDRMYFKLDAIDVNEYLKDENNELMHDPNGEPIFVTEKNYIFTVSGTNAENFILQMAHTNNNLFNYEIYSATQYDYLSEENAPSGTDIKKIVPAGTESDKIIEYETNPGGYNENTLVFADDPINKDSAETKYYVIGDKVNGSYKNNADITKQIDDTNLAKNNDNYYEKNYGDNKNVEEHAIPSYWQAELPTGNYNKQFCKYFVLKVKWDSLCSA